MQNAERESVDSQMDLNDELDRISDHLKAFEAWTNLSTSPMEGGLLEETTIEGLLLQAEQIRFTGYLELSRSTRNCRLGFRHGYLVLFFDSIDLEPTEIRHGELLARVLGWRSGSYSFVCEENVPTNEGFPVRPGKLLTVAWHFLVGKRRRFLEERPLFKNFADFGANRPEIQILKELSRARVRGETGILHITSQHGERDFIFRNGELYDVVCTTSGSQLTDMIERYGMLSNHDLSRLKEIERQTKIAVTDMALRDGLMEEKDLSLLLMLQKWERTFEVCHWEDLRAQWHEGPQVSKREPVPPPTRMLLPRCQYCGAETNEKNVCQACTTRSKRMNQVRTRFAQMGENDKKRSVLARISLKRIS